MFNKNDIGALPFDKLAARIREVTNSNKEERLELMRSALVATNKRKLDQAVRSAARYCEDSESGIEGLEESIAEQMTLPDPEDVELSTEDVRECRIDALQAVMPSFLETYDIGSKYTWLLPQLRSFFGKWKLVYGENGLVDALATLTLNAKDDFSRGLYSLAMWSRSDLIKGKDVRLYQVAEYNNLVPLILSAFKVYQNIPYSKWDREGLSLVVDAPLCDAMLDDVPDLSSEEWLEIRNDLLKFQTGTKKGQSRDPKTAAMLYGVQYYDKYPIKHMSRLGLVMKAQIWCAHPANRSVHMVLDPKNWDTMPEPLIDTDSGIAPKAKMFASVKPTRTVIDW